MYYESLWLWCGVHTVDYVDKGQNKNPTETENIVKVMTNSHHLDCKDMYHHTGCRASARGEKYDFLRGDK